MAFNSNLFEKQLTDFYLKSLNCKKDFYVCLSQHTRRFIQILSEDNILLAELNNKILDSNTFLTNVDSMIGVYRKTGKFPTIGIIEDILVHGRRLSYFLDSLEKKVYKCLNIIESDKHEVEKNLCKSITIWVYAVNDVPLLMPQIYQWRLCYNEVLPESKWRKYSKYIYDKIKESGKYSLDKLLGDTIVGCYNPSCLWNIQDELDLRAYNLGVEHERKAYFLGLDYASGAQTSICNLCSTGKMRLMDFVKDANGTREEILNHVASMIDSGYISLHTEIIDGKLEYYIHCTPLTLFILPKKLGPFYQNMFSLSQTYWMDDDFPLHTKDVFEHLSSKYEGAEKIINLAIFFSEKIRDNRMLLRPLLNWVPMVEDELNKQNTRILIKK